MSIVDWARVELFSSLGFSDPRADRLHHQSKFYGERSQLSLHFTHSLSLLRSGTLGWLLPHLQTNIFSCGNVNSASPVFSCVQMPMQASTVFGYGSCNVNTTKHVSLLLMEEQQNTVISSATYFF